MDQTLSQLRGLEGAPNDTAAYLRKTLVAKAALFALSIVVRQPALSTLNDSGGVDEGKGTV